MSEATFNISLVRFAEADWKLLISYFVIIVSLSMIVYFAIFVDEKDTQVEVNLENNSVHHFVEETPAAVSSPVATTSVTPTKRRPSLGGSEKKTKTPASESKPKTPKSEKKRAESPNPVKARSTTPAKRTSSTPKQRTTTPKRAKSGKSLPLFIIF